MSDEELRKLLKNELIQAGRFQRGTTFRQGDMSRFFINLLATALLYTFTFRGGVLRMAKYTRDDIVKLVNEENVKYIRLQFTDILGTIKTLKFL